MIKICKSIHAFLNLNNRTKLEVVTIVLIFIKANYIIRFIPLRKYHNRFFANNSKLSCELYKYKDYIDLITKVLKHLPGKHTCLKESIIVHLFMEKKNVYIPLYLGVSTQSDFIAHAWYDHNSINGFNKLASYHGEKN